MDARHCKRCKKIFQYTGSPICPKCVKELDIKFNDVRDYIYDNPGANMDEVCEATSAEKVDIRRWLAEGRLMLAESSPISLKCEKCGAPILTGKQCDVCLNKLRSTLQGAADSLKPPPPKEDLRTSTQKYKDKMHLKDRKL